MSRSQAQVLDEIASDHLPSGDGWPHGTTSAIARMFSGLAVTTADFEAAAEAMLQEIDPRTAVHLLEDFQRCLGPDPFGRDAAPLTPEQQALLAYQRWTSRGGLSRNYFLALAASLGVTITITKYTRNCLGRLKCGMPLRNHPNEFVWTVTMPASSVTTFRTGISRTGRSLGTIARNTMVEAAFQALKPPYTDVAFNYTGTS